MVAGAILRPHMWWYGFLVGKQECLCRRQKSGGVLIRSKGCAQTFDAGQRAGPILDA